MPEHRIGTREEWQAARDELAKLEGEQAKQNEEITRARRDLPWVRVEKEYEFDTDKGKKTLAELFDGRSQLLGLPDGCSEGRTLIIDAGRLVGIISPSDINRLLQTSVSGRSRVATGSA